MGRPRAFALIFNEDNDLLVVRSRTQDYFKLPGGKVDEGESFGEALIREIKEELGCGIKHAELVHEYSHPRHIQLFLVELAGKPTPHSEIERLYWLSQEDIRNRNVKLAKWLIDPILPDISMRISA